VPLDDGHDVVEFMGQAGGQLADGRQALLAHDEFLVLLQGPLRLLAFRHFLLQAFGPFVNQWMDLVVPLPQNPPTPALRPTNGGHHRKAATMAPAQMAAHG
jgi:hypothetical protein